MYSVESVSGIERTETNGSQKAAGEGGKWTETGGWKGGDEMLVDVLTMHATQQLHIRRGHPTKIPNPIEQTRLGSEPLSFYSDPFLIIGRMGLLGGSDY